MKKILYFLRSYIYDFLTAFFALILTIITFFYAKNQQISFFLSFIIILISLIIIIYLRFRDKDFYFISLTNRKDRDDWIGFGNFEYTRSHKCFLITNADPGYIYSKCLTWSDYNFSFDFKILNTCLGVIVRSVNLSNYVMLQITKKGIRPHIRINGGWKWWECPEASLEFENELLLDKYYKCLLSCENDSINIKLYDDKSKLFDRGWKIPRGSLVFQFKKDEVDKKPVKIPFPINLEYGSVGFRNFGDEKALIKNMLIEKF